MKNIKNANGFTLIELLAVIVVLAIVILMASMAVIPRMNQARKQVFAMEANEAINAASAYWLDATINGTDTFPIGTDTKCVTIATLRENGDFKNDNKYNGVVIVKNVGGNNYAYSITMGNGNLMVVKKGYTTGENSTVAADVKPDNVEDYVDSKVPTTCDGATF